MSLLNILLIALILLAAVQVYSLIKNYKALSVKNVWLTELNALIDGENYIEAEYFGINLLNQYASDADLHYSLGYSAYKLGRVDEALTHMGKAITLNKKMAAARHSLGYIWFYDKKNAKRAIPFLKEAIKCTPSYNRSYNTLAIVLDSEGETKEAFKLLKKAVKKYGAEATSLGTLGLLAFKQKDFIQAEEYFKKSIGLSPSFDAFCNLGNLYSMQLDYPEAVAAFKKAEELEGSDKQIKYWLGSALYLNQELKEAEVKLSEAIALDKAFAKAYLQRAFVYKKLKKNDAFLADYNKALSLDPSLKEKGEKNG